MFPLEDHVILRSRECIQEGARPHWTDRMFYDGKVYLSLEHNDTWTVHVPQAMTLKVLLDEQVERTRAERIRLQEGCIQLMNELKLSEEWSGMLPCISLIERLCCCLLSGSRMLLCPSLSVASFPLHQILILIMLLAFLGLILASFLIYKNQGK